MTLQIFNKPEQLPPETARGVGLGFFDGVHRGHLELIRTLVFESRREGLTSAVFTFPCHPSTVLLPDAAFDSYLCPLEERLRLLAETGLKETHLQDFDAAFAAVEPLDFLNEILDRRLRARLVVVGHDYRFGCRGKGDAALLQSWASERGIRVLIVDEIAMYGERVSSSRIRNLIAEGDMIRTAGLLGRPYSLSGQVVGGRRLGRRLGFPTANLDVQTSLACPAFGVYATRTRSGGRAYDSITNIGNRPTVSQPDGQPVVETFLFDAEMDLYDERITVEFLDMIRPEQRFDTLEALAAQVECDKQVVREWHARAEIGYEKARIQGIPVYWLPTARFAQAAAHLVFTLPLEKRRAAAMALLMRTLTASCRRHPSRTSLASALDNLYGATIEANLEKQGDLQLIDLSADALIRWTDGSSPFQESIGLMFDLLLDPLTDENGRLDPDTVEAERQNLLLELASRENDRAKYSYDRCLDIFCGGGAPALSPIGDRESLLQVNREDLRQAYDYLLRETSVAVYVGGNISQDTLETCLSGLARLPAADRPVLRPAEYPSPFQPAAPAGVREHKTVEQARIAMAYTGLPPYFSHRSIVATLLNSMLGGDVHSLLFDVVREKMGLAYSIFSMNQRSLAALIILAGVAADQVAPALDAARRQVAALADGHFDRQLFDRSVQMLETSILSTQDDLSAMLAQQIIGRLYGRLLTRGESLTLLREVTPPEIAALAGRLRLVSCYALTAPGLTPDLSASGLPAAAIREAGGEA